MSNSKKFYWLKLKEDFFRDKRIKKLRRVAGGDTFTIIYLKLQLLSLKNDGVLIYEGVEDSFAEEMALEIDEDTENVRFTLIFLQQNGLLDEIDKDRYVMTETIQCIGSETASAERVRRHRELKQKHEEETKLLQSNSEALQCNTAVTKCNIEIEKENRDKREELEIDKDINTANAVGVEPKILSFEEVAFNQFWSIYPKKINKKGCFKTFKNIKHLKNELPLILDAIERLKKSKAWTKDNGQYIPYPQTFLRQERWKDVQEETLADKITNIDMTGWL